MLDVWNYAVIGLAGGAAAFAHCLGMCGGWRCTCRRAATAARSLARQGLWHLGKTTTYVFLGAMAGLAAAGSARPAWPGRKTFWPTWPGR